MQVKNQREILKKIGIASLNEMQVEAGQAIYSSAEIILLSPTGTGKTLAFLLPIVGELRDDNKEVQVLIVVPSRELALQIELVLREMGTGYKVNAFYGGRAFAKDRADLKHKPAILIATPGRLADHLRRDTFNPREIRTLVLDEFDKSLEIGFESEMREIVEGLPSIQKRILTSATHEVIVPEFVGLSDPKYVNFLDQELEQLQLKAIISPEKDKLDTLLNALCHLADKPGIVFCNFKDSIRRVSDFLSHHKVPHGCFFGGMEQKQRERALIKFRNGSHQLLLATDLASRGIDVPEIEFIIHYHLPVRSQEFVHRNGRTARMQRGGTAFILHWKEERLPDFIPSLEEEILNIAPVPKPSPWATVLLSGGRKDKISKGDIAGFFLKQGGLSKEQLGLIELKQDCAFAAVAKNKVPQLIHLLDNQRLKKRKLRITKV